MHRTYPVAVIPCSSYRTPCLIPSLPTRRSSDLNAGTAMRLFAGLLAGQRFATELTGDASLTKRPMNRVADPLRLIDRKSTRLNSSHVASSYAVFCLKKKKHITSRAARAYEAVSI